MPNDEQLEGWRKQAWDYDRADDRRRRGELTAMAKEMFPRALMTPGMWRVVEEEYARQNPGTKARYDVSGIDFDAKIKTLVREILSEIDAKGSAARVADKTRDTT